MLAFPAAKPLLACSVALCAVAVGAPHATPGHLAAALALCFVPYALLLRVPIAPDGRALRLALIGAGLAGAIMALGPSPLSDDVYRYLWDGRQWLAGHDAYALPPSDPTLAPMRDAAWSRINHRDIPTIYPPLAQALFAVGALLWPGIAALKWLSLGCHLATTLIVQRLAAALGDPAHAARAGVLWALNPLLLQEAAMGGHVDAAAGLAVAGFALALQRGRAGQATALAAAASGLKLLGLLLAPLLWRARASLAAIAMLASLACALPLVHAGHGRPDTASGIAHYAQRWRGNEGPFRALEWLADPIVCLLGRDARTGRYPAGDADELQLSWLPSWLSAANSDVYRVERKTPRPPGRLPRSHLRFLLARSLSAMLVAAVILVALRRRTPPVTATRAVLFTLLLTSPQVHPWYLAWLLPVELALGRNAGLLWSATALLAYAPLAAWQRTRVWTEPTWSYVALYAPVLCALLLEQVREAKAKPHVGLR